MNSIRHLLKRARDLFLPPMLPAEDDGSHQAESWLFTVNVVTHTDPSNLGTCFEAYSMLSTCREAQRCERPDFQSD